MVRKNIYLGRRIKDIGIKGLSHKKEFEGIMLSIIRDYKKGRISKRTAQGRLLLLYRLTYKKNNHNLRISPSTASELRKRISNAMKRYF